MQVEQLSLLVDYMRPAERQNSLAQNSHGGSHPNYDEKKQPEIKNICGERFYLLPVKPFSKSV